jgi:hypothetical protein
MKYRVRYEIYIDGGDVRSPLAAAQQAFDAILNGQKAFTVRKVMQRGRGGLGPEFLVDLSDATTVAMKPKKENEV